MLDPEGVKVEALDTSHKVTLEELCQKHEGFLLDAYGVLVDSDSVLPGADAFLRRLSALGKPYRIISNDASATPEAKVKRWAERGLSVSADHLLTPWHLLGSPIPESPSTQAGSLSVNGRGCYLVGSELSREMLRRAGGRLVENHEELDVFLIADETDPRVWSQCDQGLSLLERAFREGRTPQLLLVNPDLVYPSRLGFGFTAGSIALMFEAALKRLFGAQRRFVPVGKPQAHLFELGLRHLNIEKSKVAMVGDQLETDVAGALQVGVTAVLIGSGVTTLSHEVHQREPRALHLESLAVG